MTQQNQDFQDYSTENIDDLTLLEIMAAHSDDIRADRITLEMTQDLPAAVVLSRIVYWFSPSKKDGQKRTRILKEGKSWVAKTDEDWWDECGVTDKQMKRIKGLLITLGVIDIKVFKFDGTPTTHYFLNIEAYAKLYKETAQKMVKKKITIVPKGNYPKLPKGTFQSDKRELSITEELDKKTYTKELDKTKCSGASARILSLLQECFKFVFSSQANALCWMINLGLPEKIAGRYLGENKLIDLHASADYLRNYVRKNNEKEKINVPGYFRRIVENKWYQQPKPGTN